MLFYLCMLALLSMVVLLCTAVRERVDTDIVHVGSAERRGADGNNAMA